MLILQIIDGKNGATNIGTNRYDCIKSEVEARVIIKPASYKLGVLAIKISDWLIRISGQVYSNFRKIKPLKLINKVLIYY